MIERFVCIKLRTGASRARAIQACRGRFGAELAFLGEPTDERSSASWDFAFRLSFGSASLSLAVLESEAWRSFVQDVGDDLMVLKTWSFGD